MQDPPFYQSAMVPRLLIFALLLTWSLPALNSLPVSPPIHGGITITIENVTAAINNASAQPLPPPTLPYSTTAPPLGPTSSSTNTPPQGTP